MKKFLCVLLAVVMLLGLVACGKDSGPDAEVGQGQEVTKPADDSQGKDQADATQPDDGQFVPPVEDGDKMDRAYEGDLISTDALIEEIKEVAEKSYKKDNKYNEFADFLEKINGRILDIYCDTSNFYILTNRGLYCLNHLRETDIEPVPIKADDHCGIYAINDGFIILIRNDGKYDLWGKDPMTSEWISCEFNVYVTNGLDYIVLGDTPDYRDSYVGVIHGEISEKFVVDVYEFVLDDNKYEFENIGTQIEYAVTDNEETKLSAFYTVEAFDTLGLALFDNGEMYLAELRFGDYWDEKGFYLYDQCFTDIDYVYDTGSILGYYAVKKGDNNLYYYELDHSNGAPCLKEIKCDIPYNITADNINQFVPSLNYNYVETKDGQWYKVPARAEESKELYVFKEELYPQIQDGLIAMTYLEGINIYLMDDHHLYTKK